MSTPGTNYRDPTADEIAGQKALRTPSAHKEAYRLNKGIQPEAGGVDGTLEVEGHAIRFTQYSPTDPRRGDPCLVLAHPFTHSRRYWRPQLVDPSGARTPLASRFTVIVFDAPGHAESALLSAQAAWDYWLMGRVATRLAEHAGFRDDGCVIIGDSQGGYSALRAALTPGSASLVRGLVLCGSSAEAEDADFVESYINQTAAGFSANCLSRGVEAALDELAAGMARIGYDYNPAAPRTTYQDPRKASHDWGASVIKEAMAYAVSRDRPGPLDESEAGRRRAAGFVRGNFEVLCGRESVLDRLGEIGCPALVIHGKRDHAYLYEREHWKRMANGLKQSETFIVDDAPHFITVTHAEAINARILEFIDSRVL